MLDGVTDEFLRETASRPALAETVLDQLGVYRDSVIAALPHLADQLGWEPTNPHMPEQFGAEPQCAGPGSLPARVGHAGPASGHHSGRLPVVR